ncbi:hypothetical protein [Tolypothrix sp. VBCCA 56010]|uniref:hypothetical protein n=1 Tax=Tolypothrix sp. VBCCA 56010 TaxID=3137731 RepID=UPI003D7D8BD8
MSSPDRVNAIALTFGCSQSDRCLALSITLRFMKAIAYAVIDTFTAQDTHL